MSRTNRTNGGVYSVDRDERLKLIFLKFRAKFGADTVSAQSDRFAARSVRLMCRAPGSIRFLIFA